MREGQVWFTAFRRAVPRPLRSQDRKVSEYPLPVIKDGFPIGTLDLEADKSGKLWVSMMYQGGVARFDPQDREVRDLGGAEGMADRRHPAGRS